MNLKDKVVIVTGSSSVTGIGSVTAKLLAGRGCRVVVNYVTNQAGAEETVAACVAAGGEAIAVQGNVAGDADCKQLVAAALERWGRLDALINNAATTKTISHADLEALDADEFQRVLSVNLVGTYQMTRAAAPHLKASGDASIVNISSTGAIGGAGSSIAYCASKGGLNTMTISFARILAPEIRVNTLCPGGVLGNAWTTKILSAKALAERKREAETTYPLRRAVTPLDVAEAALWLTESARSMTGEIIRMDSGRHLL